MDDNDNDNLDAHKVALGSIHLALQNILSTLIGALGFAFLARVITQEEMGIIAAVTLLISFVQIISDLGLNASLPKFVSESKGRGEDISVYVLSSLGFRLVVSLLTSVIVFLFSKNISTVLFESEVYSDLVRLSAAVSFLTSVIPIFNSVLWGAAKLRSVALYGVLSSVVQWLFIAVFLLSGHGIYGIVLGWIAGDAILFLLYLPSFSRVVNLSRRLFVGSFEYLPSLLRFSWVLYIASIVSFIYGWYDRFLVLAYLPLADLGVYDMSSKPFSLLTSIATALGSSLFPYYGMAYGRNDPNAVSLGIKRASKYTMIAIFPMTMGLFATSKPVITIFAGQQYEPGWPVLATLSLFGLVFGLSSALSNLLLIYERTKTILALSFISVISSLSLLPLLWVLNLPGLAVIKGISLLLGLLLPMYTLSKILKVEIDVQTLIKALSSSVVMAIAVLSLQQFYYSKFLLPFYVIVGVLVYASSLRLMKVLDQSDLQLLSRIAGERITRYVVKALGYSEIQTKEAGV